MTELARTRPESFFADRFNVTGGLLERVLGSNLLGRADDADIYLEYRVNEELQLEEGTVKKASRHVSQGAGVRALSGTRTGYAHTDDISLQNLEEAARQARAIADRAGVSGAVAVPSRGRPHDLYAIAEAGGKREIGAYGGGGRVAFDFFLEDGRWRRFALEAARQAVLKLGAVNAPAGTMTVVLGPGWPGILLHEAVGHGLEGDFNRKGTSAFAGRMGQKVASELVTVIDDGTIPNRRGSLNVDDEGTPTGRTVLIEKGILVGYMQDRLNARLMGMAATGNGRRESYAYPPMPRMTNTFMPAGEDDPEDIIKSVRRGLYAVSFGGGQVDITNGKFVFSASEAYLVEDGRVTSPVKGATLIGNGPEALTRVVRVGRDLKLDEGVGTCGKEGQSVPVGVGLPTIRIDELTVGGTAV